jgi:hypothetical protein
MRDISRGDADVTIRNGQVNAKLFFEDSKKEVQISQKGSITGENVVVGRRLTSRTSAAARPLAA